MKPGASLYLTLAILLAPPLLAQGTITDGTAEFVRGASPWDTSPTADFRGVSTTLTQDHLFETGWWFRVAGDTQEFNFPIPDVQSYVGSTSTVTWNDVNARALFGAQEVSTVFDTSAFYGTPSGYVQMVMTITNLTASQLDLDIFHFTDFDVNGAGSDSAALTQFTPLAIMEITDPSGNFAQYLAVPGWSGYMVTPFGANDVAAQLSDSAITNFMNTGLPFGPADFVGGWQFPLSIAPFGSAPVVVLLSVNATGYCSDLGGVYCDGFESQDTFFWTVTVP